jgi:hypothetical protein
MLSEREEILKEIVDRVGGEIGREIVAQKTEQFMKYGNIFLFFEVMNLRKELQILKSKAQSPLAIQHRKR